MKRIIVCCDGTWNDADNQSVETNVFLIAKAIHANVNSNTPNAVQQIVLYLRGVGTSESKIENDIEGATGNGIDENIQSAYMFIAQNYEPNDEIFLFGFSRGAYTARSLAGFINACGLLKRHDLSKITDAWAYYRKPPPHDPKQFMKACSADCYCDATIKFLGVWDTVGALGIPGALMEKLDKKKFGFYDTGPCAIVKHGCHAMAIDEHRGDFVPTLWTGETPEGVRIEQVWFAGVHADVGGGYVNRLLADIPLVWMARKAEADGLSLDWTCLPDPKFLNPLAPTHDSSTGFFKLDTYRPTVREVLGTPCKVSFNEKLYGSADNNGNPLATINEQLHRSTTERYGKEASICLNDTNKTIQKQNYAPENLAPFFNPNGEKKDGVPIAD